MKHSPTCGFENLQRFPHISWHFGSQPLPMKTTPQLANGFGKMKETFHSKLSTHLFGDSRLQIHLLMCFKTRRQFQMDPIWVRDFRYKIALRKSSLKKLRNSHTPGKNVTQQPCDTPDGATFSFCAFLALVERIGQVH